jgi:hypothetical protein
VFSSHYHLLLRVDEAQQLARFMAYFNGNLAREVARLTGWKDKVWSRRYESILVTEEDAAQVDRLRYLLENSCKEGLVDSPIHWPGVHCAKALITGNRVEGTWFDRKFEYNARLQGKEPGPREFASTEEVVLSQLPCWRDLAPEAYRSRVAELVREIEESAAAARRETGREPLGEEGVRAQDPETRPRKIKKSPAPFVHAATKSARKAMWEAYGWFVAAFRAAADKLKAGDRSAAFPAGSFPPGLPFVGA